MRPIYKQSKIQKSALLSGRLVTTALILQFALIQQTAFATAAYDNDNNNEQQSTQPPDSGTPDTVPPVNANSGTSSSSSAPVDTSPTYSIRLPQAVTGSVVPIIPTGRPHTPPGNPFMPSTVQDADHPLAWRATAEAIRQQQPSQSLIVSNFKSDFKSTYSNMLREFESTGWSLSSLSLPAGHFLIRIPRSTSTTGSGASPEDAAAWLILSITPVDSENTEVRIKIQSRHPGQFLAALNAVVQRCQLKSNGNQLL